MANFKVFCCQTDKSMGRQGKNYYGPDLSLPVHKKDEA